MDGKQILKKSKKIPTKIKVGYIISILVIIAAIYLINSAKKSNEGIEPINISEVGTYEIGANQYVSIDVQGLTNEIARLGDSNNIDGRYFIALSDENLFLVDLDNETMSNALLNYGEALFNAGFQEKAMFTLYEARSLIRDSDNPKINYIDDLINKIKGEK